MTGCAGAALLPVCLADTASAQRARAPGHPPPVFAQQTNPWDRGTLVPRGRKRDHPAGPESGQYVPLATILATIRRQYPGKHLNTRTTGSAASGSLRYQILWLTPDGRRLDITADAQTGRILSVRGQ